MKPETLLLNRSEVARLLSPEECIRAVEDAFRLYAEGKMPPPGLLGVHSEHGGLHIKAGLLNSERPIFVAKLNANFPGNMDRGLPTIQGVIVVCDAANGSVLAVLDSIEITILRTGAATAVAAKYLALPGAETLAIIGCGNQGRVSARMLSRIRPVKEILVYDIDPSRATEFAREMAKELNVTVSTCKTPRDAAYNSWMVVTCTTSTRPLLFLNDILPGTFIAAVGADSEQKQELQPELLAAHKVVVDILNQCATIGELHHAIESGSMSKENVYAELGDIVSGKKKGRSSEKEVIIFDSTGSALQDLAAVSILLNKEIENIGRKVNFG